MQSRTRHSLEPVRLTARGLPPIPPCCRLGRTCCGKRRRRRRRSRSWAGLPAIGALLGADYVALAGPAAGRWTTLAASGAARQLPVELLANALDRETALADADWIAAPLASRAEEGEVLAVHLAVGGLARRPACRKHLREERREGVGGAGQSLRSCINRSTTCAPIAPATSSAPPGSRPGNRQPVEPDQRTGAALDPDGRGGLAAAGSRSREHLPLGSAEPYAGRPSGAGFAGGRIANPRRSRRRRRGDSHAESLAGSMRQSSRRPSIATSMRSSATRRARCCAFPCGGGRANCSARSS